MIEAVLVYKNKENIKLTWMMNVWNSHPKPDSLELAISTALLGSEIQWLEKLVDWVYKNNDNRDIKVNGKFLLVDNYGC